MWECDICHKVEVPDKGKGFRAFVEYDAVTIYPTDQERLPMKHSARHQIRICPACLKKNYETITL